MRIWKGWAGFLQDDLSPSGSSALLFVLCPPLQGTWFLRPSVTIYFYEILTEHHEEWLGEKGVSWKQRIRNKTHPFAGSDKRAVHHTRAVVRFGWCRGMNLPVPKAGGWSSTFMPAHTTLASGWRHRKGKHFPSRHNKAICTAQNGVRSWGGNFFSAAASSSTVLRAKSPAPPCLQLTLPFPATLTGHHRQQQLKF